MNKDLEHLKILSICYYVFAGLTALISCFFIIHVAMGIMFLSVDFPANSQGEAPPAFMGWLFIGVGSFAILLGWTMALVTFIAGKRIKQHRNHLFCLIVAGLICMSFPLGTVLGVFTFVVLLRDSVKALFNNNVAPNFSSFGNTPPDWK